MAPRAPPPKPKSSVYSVLYSTVQYSTTNYVLYLFIASDKSRVSIYRVIL